MHEFDLIQRFFKTNADSDASVLVGIGDDSALLDIKPHRSIVVATDSMVENVHFSAITPIDAIAHKLVVSNISDIIASGATPKWATLSLTLPSVDESWLTLFSHTLYAQLKKYGVSLVGGDTTSGKQIHLCMTIIGECQLSQYISRGGAKAGDVICLCGHVGDSTLGLAIEQYCQQNPSFIEDASNPAALHTLLHRFYYPEVSIELGHLLTTYASAMIDVSDGLLQDLDHIIKSSEQASHSLLGFELDFNTNIMSDEFIQAGSSLLKNNGLYESHQNLSQFEAAALTSGEEYVLCMTLSPHQWQLLQKEYGHTLEERGNLMFLIGKITHDGRYVVNGQTISVGDFSGYKHFG